MPSFHAERFGFLRQAVKPVGNAGNVWRRDAVGYALGCKAFVHADKRFKILPSERTHHKFATFVGQHRNRLENNIQGAHHRGFQCKLRSNLTFTSTAHEMRRKRPPHVGK